MGVVRGVPGRRIEGPTTRDHGPRGRSERVEERFVQIGGKVQGGERPARHHHLNLAGFLREGNGSGAEGERYQRRKDEQAR